MTKQAITWSVVLVASSLAIGCAKGDPVINDGPDGGSMSEGGGGDGGEGGDGAGGEGGPCDIDCSAVDVADCFVSVCNEGQHEGTIGECVVVKATNGSACDDGMFCTANDACDEGTCVGGPLNTCGLMPNACAEIACDEAAQECTSTAAPDGGLCLPESLCEVNGVCTNGQCVGTPKECFFAPVGDCESASCNEATGECEPFADATLDGRLCGDAADLCTVNTVCAAGVCGGGVPMDCSALDAGCVNGVCDQVNGTCIAETVAVGDPCFDGVGSCEAGTCDAASNCVAAPLAMGTMCDDFSACTDNDQCDGAGTCAGAEDLMCTIAYLDEAFETCPPAGWLLSGEWECGAPSIVGPDAAFEGTNVLGTDLDGEYDDELSYATTFAQTPPIGLGIATQPVLSFWHWYEIEGFDTDGYTLSVSTNGGASFAPLTTVTPAYNQVADGVDAYGGTEQAFWERVFVDLSAYAGQQIVLRFAFHSTEFTVYPGVYIDDIDILEAQNIPVDIVDTAVSNSLAAQPFAVQMSATGGTGSGNWSLVAGGTNDGWLSIDSAGLLSGTPAVANLGPVAVTVRYEDGTNTLNFDEVTLQLNVDTALLFDDIEAACPGMWTLSGDWQCGVPTSGPNAAFSGTQVLATNLAGDYSPDQTYATNTATAGPISLVGATDPELRFNVWHRVEGSIYDGFNVKISTDGGATYVVAAMVTPAYPLTIDGETVWGGEGFELWDQYAVDLTPYVGMSVNIRFSMRSDTVVQYPGVYIDDVTIAD